MYYQNYEDYMRQILGYPAGDTNIYEPYEYKNNQNYEDTYYLNQCQINMTEEEIMNCYPEIYHKIYPMVCRACDSCVQPITKDLIEKMTNEIYNSIAQQVKETRQSNFSLRDLITILILNRILSGNRPPRPRPPRPPYPGRPGRTQF